ncbi:hypothetical protein HPB49_011582 [Dermacentor silvarum]|uniref:Uncharacterized protein n=1 Tax=Dermacentor silvarum TaxID=543639 RepID=A0ACB8DZ77_DERSI|nr:hypothetical protein HPB49_011582 [Dermacentor silvarum]
MACGGVQMLDAVELLLSSETLDPRINRARRDAACGPTPFQVFRLSQRPTWKRSSSAVDDADGPEATAIGRRGKYAAYLVGNCPSLCLSVQQLISDLRYHRSIPSRRWVNPDTSYLASTANGYFLFAQLPIWNEFLSVINVKLREVSPGQVALACLRGRLAFVASNMQRRHSFGLIHWLLMEYCGIKFVELCESNTFQSNFLFLDDFWLSCNLWHVKLCSYLLDDYLPKGLVDALRSAVTTLDTLEIMSARFLSVRSCERLREYAAYLVGSCSSLCLPVNQPFSNLRYPRSIPSHRRVNYNWRTASEANACFLLAELTLLVNFVVNKFLWVNFEIQAVGAGRLALARLHGRVVLVSSNMQRRHSFVRVRPMVLELRSVKFLELCEPRISQNHFLFRGGLRVSRHMWYVKLCHYLLEDYSNKCLIEAPHSPVTTLDTLESVSVRFSSVGVQVLREIPGNCEALRAPVLLENCIDVPATEELRRADAQQSVQRQIHVHELFATIVVEELVVHEQWAPGGYRPHHDFEALFAASPTSARCSRRFEI